MNSKVASAGTLKNLTKRKEVRKLEKELIRLFVLVSYKLILDAIYVYEYLGV